MVHGDLHYNPNKIKQIESITLWNAKHKKKPIRITVSIQDMRYFLFDFKKCFDQIYKI